MLAGVGFGPGVLAHRGAVDPKQAALLLVSHARDALSQAQARPPGVGATLVVLGVYGGLILYFVAAVLVLLALTRP